jgi:hypothetical protein
VKAGLDYSNPVSASPDQHADHTGWAWDPENELFVLTLFREDDSLLAVACYTYDNWVTCFERLKASKEEIDRRNQ